MCHYPLGPECVCRWICSCVGCRVCADVCLGKQGSRAGAGGVEGLKGRWGGGGWAALVVQQSVCLKAHTSLTCMCARHKHAHTPDSWHSSTSGRCSGTSLCVSQSGCCGRGRSTAGRSPRCHVTTRCRHGHVSQRTRSPGWARRSWVSPRSRPGHAQWGAWRSCTWLSASPPSRVTRGASPPPSLRRCRTCPSGSHPACGSPAAPTNTSSPHSFLTDRDIYSAGACGRGWSEKHREHFMFTL